MVPEGGPRILKMMECEYPTGGMNDRMALAMMKAAEAAVGLRPGGSVVEYTGGSIGVSLASVRAAKGIPVRIVTPTPASGKKRHHMAALGARLTAIVSKAGGTTKTLTLEMIETARTLATVPGSCWMDQLTNPDPIPAYERMADESWDQAGANIAMARRLARRLGPGRTVVTIVIDSGMKYLSTALYSRPDDATEARSLTAPEASR